MGVLDGALLMFSVGTAPYASAEGSRVAATLGNVATTDSQVLGTVRNIVSGTQLFTVDEVDIYKLNHDGNGNLTQDLANTNKYALDGTPLNGTPWPVTTLLRTSKIESITPTRPLMMTAQRPARPSAISRVRSAISSPRSSSRVTSQATPPRNGPRHSTPFNPGSPGNRATTATAISPDVWRAILGAWNSASVS
jgi:hypothetical protein